MVIVLAFERKPILAPATNDTLLELPFKLKLVATGTFGPEIVTVCPVWLSVMLFPPTSVIPPDVMFVVAPAVLPLEICSELKTVELFVAATVIVLAFELREIPAPATIDNAPVDPFRAETLFSALLEALIVRVRDPAPDALAREMLFPPTIARLTAVPVTLVPPPLRDCVPAAPVPPLAPIIEML